MMHPSAEDLRETMVLGARRLGDLLTPAELQLVSQMERLSADGMLLLARVSGRKVPAVRWTSYEAKGVEQQDLALAEVLASGWLMTEVPWALRAHIATREILAAACRRLGLSSKGKKAELTARLLPFEGWDEAKWVALAEGPLMHRLERFGQLRRRPERKNAVMERLGRTRWMEYAPEPGGRLLEDRAELERWERVLDNWAELDVEEVFEALSWPRWPPGRLDYRPHLVDWLLAHGLAERRAGRFAEARALYERLVEVGLRAGASVAVPRARAIELHGDPEGAWRVLHEAREDRLTADQVAIDRSGRRVSKSLGRSWAPSRPLQPPRQRTLQLAAGQTKKPRPMYDVEGREFPVEAAVAYTLSLQGRRAVSAEGALWRMIFSLWIGERWFVPVPGMLPVARLSAPLDAWTPAFESHRKELMAQVRRELAEGRAVSLLTEGWGQLQGARVTGTRWSRWSLETLQRLVHGLAPEACVEIFDTFLREGRKASAGLPDLVVLPGPSARIPSLFPKRLPEELVVVEVKGPGDAVRDAQKVWFDRLLRCGVRVELWRVEAS